jgi:penicillin-binding protein 1A
MRFIKSIFKWIIIFGIWSFLILAIIIGYYYNNLPSLQELETKNQKPVININYSNQEKITTLGNIYQDDIKFYQLPQSLIHAVIATEDRRFFEHHGIDIFGISRASIVNYKAGHLSQGGSTITQQLAKFLFLSPEKTFKRKIEEILLAFELEKTFSKEQILTLYLNRAYFGSGNYGVNNAAKFYFNKSVSEIDLNEAAMLAGLLKAPSKFSPKNNPKLSKLRTKEVINNMIEAGFLTKDMATKSAPKINYQNDRALKFYFADYVSDQFTDYLSSSQSKINNLNIKTTLDQKIQTQLEITTDQFLKQNSAKIANCELAIIIMAKDGAILGMVGGKNYHQSQFNRAIYAKRQPGSAFKTLVYLTAFENGFSPDDLFEDKKTTIGDWNPENYDKKYHGQISLKQAFADSINSVAIQLNHQINQDQLINNAKKLGIISKIEKNDATISLGTSEVTPLELTNAYATIANDGYPVIPYAISEISDQENNIIYQRQSSGLEKVIPDKAKDYIKESLREVIKNGTGKNANIAQNIYGKTGTSQNFRDAWFIGFNDDYIIGIWIGNDNNSPTNKITGGGLPASLFAEILGRIN